MAFNYPQAPKCLQASSAGAIALASARQSLSRFSGATASRGYPREDKGARRRRRTRRDNRSGATALPLCGAIQG
eukprot:4848498-Pyramimonas_sp.AAC.1